MSLKLSHIRSGERKKKRYEKKIHRHVVENSSFVYELACWGAANATATATATPKLQCEPRFQHIGLRLLIYFILSALGVLVLRGIHTVFSRIKCVFKMCCGPKARKISWQCHS